MPNEAGKARRDEVSPDDLDSLADQMEKAARMLRTSSQILRVQGLISVPLIVGRLRGRALTEVIECIIRLKGDVDAFVSIRSRSDTPRVLRSSGRGSRVRHPKKRP